MGEMGVFIWEESLDFFLNAFFFFAKVTIKTGHKSTVHKVHKFWKGLAGRILCWWDNLKGLKLWSDRLKHEEGYQIGNNGLITSAVATAP